MLVTPDTYLISVMQDFVNWVETKTSMERRNLGELLSNFNTAFMSLYALVLICFISFVGPLEAFKQNLVFGTLLVLHYVAKKNLQENMAQTPTVHTSLPKEIIKRKFERVITSAIFVLTILNLIFFTLNGKMTGAILGAIGTCSFSILTLIEYFLCTTGLPPSVIKKKKEESQAANLVPSTT